TLIFLTGFAFTQIENAQINEGNQLYQQGQYAEAESKYNQALDKNQNSHIGAFNKANAIYKQDKYEEAYKEFENIANSNEDRSLKAKAYHNLGNAYLNAKKISEAVSAYKSSLRLNPNDDETRYNLAYAQQLLKQQESQKNDKDKNEEDKKNQDSEDKKEQEKEEQDKKEENKKDGENEEGDKKDKDSKGNDGEQKNNDNEEKNNKGEKPKPRPGQLSQEEAKRMLEAMQNEERNVQEKLVKKKLKGQKVKIEKDW
ncbi:MAG: tetratricopeptide repeat protein, partial [Flavobacteriales bacterium]|nr:tetratricopeptide repeat protein [Flavobacteriales bacterium]